MEHAGGATLFVYAIHREDPVFIIGQGAGLFIYARNLWLIRAARHRAQHVPLVDVAGHVVARLPVEREAAERRGKGRFEGMVPERTPSRPAAPDNRMNP